MRGKKKGRSLFPHKDIFRRLLGRGLGEKQTNRLREKEDFAYLELNKILDELSRRVDNQRVHYLWGVLQGAFLASALGERSMSVIEFGVAGGNGLMALEACADLVEEQFDVRIDVYGFDSGRGLPPPVDYRDLPHLWSSGAYPMDEACLRRRLDRAQLVVGLVADTLPTFLEINKAPVGFIAFDFDQYTSTVDALELLWAETRHLLPRIICYFDDILGFTYSDFTGERLAIREFNARTELRKLSPIYGLRYYVPPRFAGNSWTEKMFMAHLFDHCDYGRHDGQVRRAILSLGPRTR